MDIPAITPQGLYERINAGMAIDLIDVRTPAEFREVHAKFARLIPLDQLDPMTLAGERNGSADEPLYVICHSGSRARQACEKLISAGISNVIQVEGGTQAWELAGLPVVRGKKTISLERQVRIANGTLTLIGALLAILVHPYFVVIPAFMGAGNIFAGITDTCGMGMLLAKMSWNKASGTRNCSAGDCRAG